MKNLDFLFIGTSKNQSYKKLESLYLERVQHYQRSARIHYLKDQPHKNISLRKEKETQDLLKWITPKDVIVVCDERGKNLTSEKLSQKLDGWMGQGQRLVFVIGGAYGMTDEILSKAQFVLKLSEMTLPHELARVVLLEQVYRAFTILRGEKYHH